MAKKIQDGERAAGKPDFQGFVFEGKAGESLTCNALEWIYSYGGGSVIEPDKKVTINNPNAIKALDAAHSWIGTISPVEVNTYTEEEARNIWQAGNAAFMRNWPYAYALGADPKSAVSGKFDVTVLPKGGDNGNNAACLGGHQLMISATRRCLTPPRIWFDTSPRQRSKRKERSIGASFPPGRSCTATRTCSRNTLFLRSCRMFSTTPWPGLQPSPGPITISCRRPFPKT